jgi:uncharacterized membrane protein YqaE (UPF0057 family)
MGLTVRDLGELVLAILLPPLAVFLHKGQFDTDVLINILLCLLGWLPGALHAWDSGYFGTISLQQ